MSDNYRADDIKLFENTKDVTGITKVKMSEKTSEPSLKVLQLVSIFEDEESKTKLKLLSQGGSGTPEPERPRSDVPEAEAEAAGPSGACASGVAVTNYTGVGGCGWMERPERNLLFVIHPWCMLRKSDADRQSEFPPPGFLERLKAKLLALHGETDEPRRPQGPAAAAKRRRDDNQRRIRCWFQYTAAMAALHGAGSRTKAIAAGPGGAAGGTVRGAAAAIAAGRRRPEPAATVDFLSVRRRYAAAVAMDRGVDDC